MSNSNIWAISDTHEQHEDLVVPKDIDIVMHTGDSSNPRSPSMNEEMARVFFEWYSDLYIPHKIYVPGNHDTAFYAKYILPEEYPKITFLENRAVTINGKKIYGSPYTPNFGSGWAYNMGSSSIEANWKGIPRDTNILLTHGPPYGVMDLAPRDIHAGCPKLLNAIEEMSELELHIFGHIHSNNVTRNSGVLTEEFISINASVVNDYHEIVNNGQILII